MTLQLTEHWVQFVAVAMFLLGLFGFLVRRNAIVVLMCIELMLNAANLLFADAAVRVGNQDGFLVILFTITIAAAEAAIGLGLILNLYRLKGTVEMK